MNKKNIIIAVVAIVIIAVAVVAAFVLFKPEAEVKPEANVAGTLEEIMGKVYAGIPEENLPMLGDMPIDITDSEAVAAYLGTSELSIKEALAREPMIGSIPHSVVLVRLNDAKDAKDAVAKIKANANPRKWICVQAKNVFVESKGDLVILIMADAESPDGDVNDIAPKLKENFGGLK